MLAARHDPWARALFAPYLRRLWDSGPAWGISCGGAEVRWPFLPLAMSCDFYEDAGLLEQTCRAAQAREPGQVLLSGRRQLSERWKRLGPGRGRAVS